MINKSAYVTHLGVLARRWSASALVVLWLVTCPASSTAAENIRSDTITFEFALYFSPNPSADPKIELNRLLADHRRRLRLSETKETEDAIGSVESHWVPLVDYAPPDAESLSHNGVGVGSEEAAKLAAAKRVFILVFSTPRHGALVVNRAACELLADLAQATRGSIWDEETRQLFSREKWRQVRVETWQGNLPDLPRHVTMHAYSNPELIRVVTLGMRKFGLPDLVISEIPQQHSGSIGDFINAFMQRLIEGQRPENFQMVLKLSDIRNDAVRSRLLSNPAKGAKGTVSVSTKSVVPEQGDSKNALWRLDFPESKINDTTERSLWGTSELFGSTDAIVNSPSGDTEMRLASARARKAFFAQESRFRAGLAFKEQLLVKAPFTQGTQTEYMWVEVVKWNAKTLEGILSNDPFYVKNLRAGSRVTIPLVDVYDYLFYRADGTQEGNESGKVLQQREKK